MSYDEEKLGELLRRLPPAPVGWVAAAQELPTARAAMDELVARAEADAEVRRRILNDLEAALAAEGVERNSALLAELRERLAQQRFRLAASDDRVGAPQGRHRAVLRRGRLDRARRVGRPGGAAGAARPLLRADEGDRRVARRLGGEVHRRRGDGRLRRPGGARGRRAARLPGGGRDARRRSPSSASRGGSASTPARSSPAPRSGSPTGDAVNVAARLQQAADPGEILIGEATLELVRGAVETEPVEPLELKGKSRARRRRTGCVAVRDAPERSHETPLRRPRARARARSARPGSARAPSSAASCVTVVGEAGVGKSRLVAEALAAIDARVVRGRCLPYGEGITYWPVVEVVKQLDALPVRPGRGRRDPLAARRDRGAATSAEEIAWAFRKLLEEQAPLVVVFDDIQWGEETFLDLVEGVGAALAGGADPARLHGPAGAARAARRVAGHAPARAARRGRRSTS